MNPRIYYEKLVETLPVGTERAVMSVMRFHIGLTQAVSKEELKLALEKTGFRLSDERQVRLAIVNLRKQGIPLCSSSTESGYFLAATGEEFAEFANREYLKKIRDMSATLEAMQDHARDMFDSVEPGAKQMSLI